MATFIELDVSWYELFGGQTSITTGYFNIDEIITIIIQSRTISMRNGRLYYVTEESLERLRRVLDKNDFLVKDNYSNTSSIIPEFSEDKPD